VSGVRASAMGTLRPCACLCFLPSCIQPCPRFTIGRYNPAGLMPALHPRTTVAVSKRRRQSPSRPKLVPPFTGSVDAKVPAENVVLAHLISGIGRWVAVSVASDERVFHGTGATEALARRAAGLRTLDHLQKRANGSIPNRSEEEHRSARLELAQELAKLAEMVAGYNGAVPCGETRESLLVQLAAARDLARAAENRATLAKWVLPVLLFVAGAFAEGVVGAMAEKCLDRLIVLLSS
jgi:hypothetical protein